MWCTMNGRKRWKENEDKKQQMKTHLEISKLKAVVYTEYHVNVTK